MERIIEDGDRVRALGVATCEIGAKLGLHGAGLSFEERIGFASSIRRHVRPIDRAWLAYPVLTRVNFGPDFRG